MTIPFFIYGTAWKEETTAELVEKALKAGFAAIDTANQRKHYHEAQVGQALGRILKGELKREKLFIQTKFTPVDGQDHRLPYDPSADLKTQVNQSFESSLKNLGIEYIDSYLLHGPYAFPGLGEEDWQVWGAMEKLYEAGKTRFLGISNVNIFQLETLFEKARVKPHIVQNRCYANRGWDREVREFCISQGIVYEGFSLLTANPQILQTPLVRHIAKRLSVSPAQVIFRFALEAGMVPLTGTTNEQRMREDLAVSNIKLTEEEVAQIDKAGEEV